MVHAQRHVSVGVLLRGFLIDAVPALSLLALVFMAALPTSLPVYLRVGGIWPLIGITYWSLVRPRAMPMLLVFIFGLMTDIVTFLPLGLHAALFVVARYLLRRQRRFLVGQGFWVLWVAFALLSLCVYGVIYLWLNVANNITFDVLSPLWGVGIGWSCLPLILLVLSGLHRFMDLFDEPV